MRLDHYQLLGIPRDAGLRQIKAAYRNLAKRCHPDRNRGSEAAAELFRQANAAYRILSDPQARGRYDRELAEQKPAPPQPASDYSGPVQDTQKFKNFLTRLLDTLLGPGPAPATTSGRSERADQNPGPKVTRPDFNFYYHLAMEKKKTSYRCGRDGIYRRAPRRKKPAGHPSEKNS